MPVTKKEIIEHLGHVDYPAKGKDLIQACNNMIDVPKADREWFVNNLPDRTYYNADEIKKVLNL